MSAQRLLACLQLLQSERRQTARQLAERLEVSTRTVYRDVEALSSAGVPVHMERGSNGGIVLDDAYRRALARFSDDELQALFVASAAPLTELGLADPKRALAKLSSGLSATQRRAAERGRERLLVDHNRWYRPALPARDSLAILRAATAEQRAIVFSYRDREGIASERTVEPLGLVSKAGIWYLVARDGAKGVRTFRAERISGAIATSTRFERPHDFELESYWQDSIASIESTPATGYACVMRLRPDVVERVSPYWGGEVVAESPEGIDVRFRVSGAEMASYIAVSLGDGCRVIEPQALIATLVDTARAVIARYGVSS